MPLIATDSIISIFNLVTVSSRGSFINIVESERSPAVDCSRSLF
ncbi:MAG: hypothetical protein V7L01_30005 [Nostoc sp.]